ncbi:MAG: hypothetical protein AB8B49_10535 [Nitratireductor sp.]
MTEAHFQYNGSQNEAALQRQSDVPAYAGGSTGMRAEAQSGLGLIINNLERLLDEEKELLKLGNFKALEGVAGQKIQLYTQLSRFGKGALGQGQNNDLVEKIKSIKAMLLENASLLKRRMDAIGEVAETISTAMKDADGDSTYSVWPAL